MGELLNTNLVTIIAAILGGGGVAAILTALRESRNSAFKEMVEIIKLHKAEKENAEKDKDELRDYLHEIKSEFQQFFNAAIRQQSHLNAQINYALALEDEEERKDVLRGLTVYLAENDLLGQVSDKLLK